MTEKRLGRAVCPFGDMGGAGSTTGPGEPQSSQRWNNPTWAVSSAGQSTRFTRAGSPVRVRHRPLASVGSYSVVPGAVAPGGTDGFGTSSPSRRYAETE